MKKVMAALFGLGVALIAGQAFADDACAPLKLVTQVDIVSNDDNTRIYVPVKINGIAKFMILDTGSPVTMIDTSAAAELGLSTSLGQVEMYNLSGKASSGVARSGSFELGTLHADSVRFVVDSTGMVEGEKDVIGLIGADIFMNYDLEIDMAKHKLTLLSPDHCQGKVIYWPASVVAAVPLKIDNARQIGVQVALEGHPIGALIDTGAPDNTINRAIAERVYGIKPGSADTPEVGHMFGLDNAKTYSHQFKTLTFEGITVSNPTIYLLPNLNKRLSQGPQLGTRLAPTDSVTPDGLPDLMIGMSTMRHLHMYFAFKEKMLYLTP